MDQLPSHSHWARFKRLTRPLFSGDLSYGLLMVGAVVTALVLANSPWANEFHAFWEYTLEVRVAGANLELTFHELVNDGLMAIFFFVIGLEIKRELIAGELSNLRKAALPIICALGGLLFPALIFLGLNQGADTAAGWGIPIATDIVFALVLLTIIGNKKVPFALKIFLTALAVVDDLCAVLIIAFFYTDQIVFGSLLWAFVSFFVLVIANRIGVRNPFFYGLVGVLGIWTGFFLSGVHATIAGVITAAAIPARAGMDEEQFAHNIENLIKTFRERRATDSDFIKKEKLELVRIIQKAVRKIVPPLQSVEKALQPFVNFVVLPLFALANTGLTLEAENLDRLLEPLSLGIILGLVVGKFAGISLLARLSVALGIARLPERVTWPQIYGAAAFAGIGFTMSIFIGNLAFENADYLQQAKLAILVAFVLAVLLGTLIFRVFVRAERPR